MIEGRELPEPIDKTAPQEPGANAVTAGELGRDLVIEPVKVFAKESLKNLLPPEIKPILSTEQQKKPEIIFVSANREQAREATRPNTDSKPSPMAAPVSNAERMDRMQNQVQINEILRELRQTR